MRLPGEGVLLAACPSARSSRSTFGGGRTWARAELAIWWVIRSTYSHGGKVMMCGTPPTHVVGEFAP